MKLRLLVFWCQVCAWFRVQLVKIRYPQSQDVMAVTYPTTGAGSLSTGVLMEGVTTVRWGTTGLLQSPKAAANFYVVLRYSQRTFVDNQKLPQGAGLTSSRVQVVDGQQWDLTVRDDTGMSAPQIGDLITVVDGGQLISGENTTSATGIKSYEARVVDTGAEGSPKNDFTRVLTVENLLLIEDQAPNAILNPGDSPE